MAGPKTNYIASDGNNYLYAIGSEDKKIHRFSRKNNKWTTLGLDNVIKVAGGPDGTVYAVVEGDKILKYSKRMRKWMPFGTKGDAFKVTVDAQGGVYLQDNDNKLWKTQSSDLVDNRIIDCKNQVNPWMRKGGVYDLLDPEVNELTMAFNSH